MTRKVDPEHVRRTLMYMERLREDSYEAETPEDERRMVEEYGRLARSIGITPLTRPMAETERLDRLTDALVEDILKAPDEEVLCDAILDIVAKLRAKNAAQADTITQLRADKLDLMKALARFTGDA